MNPHKRTHTQLHSCTQHMHTHTLTRLYSYTCTLMRAQTRVRTYNAKLQSLTHVMH